MDFTGLKWKCRSGFAFSGGSGRIHFLTFFSFQRIPVFHSLWHPSSIFKANIMKMKVKSLCRVLPGSSILGVFQATILEWAAISFSRGSSQPRDQTQVSCIADRCFTAWATRDASICIFKYFSDCEPLLSQSRFLWLWPIYHPFTRALLITLDPTV